LRGLLVDQWTQAIWCWLGAFNKDVLWKGCVGKIGVLESGSLDQLSVLQVAKSSAIFLFSVRVCSLDLIEIEVAGRSL